MISTTVIIIFIVNLARLGLLHSQCQARQPRIRFLSPKNQLFRQIGFKALDCLEHNCGIPVLLGIMPLGPSKWSVGSPHEWRKVYVTKNEYFLKLILWTGWGPECGHPASGDQSIIPLGVVISVPPSQDTEIYRPNPSPIYYFFDGINAMVEITSSRPPRQRNGPSSWPS